MWRKIPTLLRENGKIGSEMGCWNKNCTCSAQLRRVIRRISGANGKIVGMFSCILWQRPNIKKNKRAECNFMGTNLTKAELSPNQGPED